MCCFGRKHYDGPFDKAVLDKTIERIMQNTKENDHVHVQLPTKISTSPAPASGSQVTPGQCPGIEESESTELPTPATLPSSDERPCHPTERDGTPRVFRLSSPPSSGEESELRKGGSTLNSVQSTMESTPAPLIVNLPTVLSAAETPQTPTPAIPQKRRQKWRKVSMMGR